MSGQPVDPAIEVLWDAHYYDGPRTGLVLFQGALCWFQLVDDSAEDWEYDVFPLTDSEVRFVVTEHYKFELYVGCHMSRATR